MWLSYKLWHLNTSLFHLLTMYKLKNTWKLFIKYFLFLDYENWITIKIHNMQFNCVYSIFDFGTYLTYYYIRLWAIYCCGSHIFFYFFIVRLQIKVYLLNRGLLFSSNSIDYAYSVSWNDYNHLIEGIYSHLKSREFSYI